MPLPRHASTVPPPHSPAKSVPGMNSIRAARVSNLGITVHRQTGSELAGNRQELLRECDLIGPRQVLLA